MQKNRADQLRIRYGSPVPVPHVAGSDTSKAAADSMGPHLQRLELMVLETIRGRGGCTDDEGERITGLAHQTYSARRRTLVLRGLVVATEERRATRSGRRATVWRAA